MTAVPDPSGIARTLSDVASALDSFRATDEDQENSPFDGTGEALDGLIVATAAAPGRVTSPTLRPTATRLRDARGRGDGRRQRRPARSPVQRNRARRGAGPHRRPGWQFSSGTVDITRES